MQSPACSLQCTIPSFQTLRKLLQILKQLPVKKVTGDFELYLNFTLMKSSLIASALLSVHTNKNSNNKTLLKKAMFLNHGRKPEGNISHARTVVSARFLKLICLISTRGKILNNVNVILNRKTAHFRLQSVATKGRPLKLHIVQRKKSPRLPQVLLLGSFSIENGNTNDNAINYDFDWSSEEK